MQANLTKEEQHRLIQEHLGYVRSIAAKVRQSLRGSQLDFEELVAFGSKGLVEAAQRFDPTRGVAFTTFSYYRIRGAIFDGLRQTGWLKRSRYARFSEAANSYLENHSERESSRGQPSHATTEETVKTMTDTLQDLTVIFLASFNADEQLEMADSQTPDGSQSLEGKETREAVQRALQCLPEKERLLVDYCYFQGLSLSEAGRKLGLSTSWSSRLHARAIRLLAQELGHLDLATD
jgi:RNA polymerase sigma factor for flagellar operon FliA